MIAVDTNVVVRLLIADDARQAAQASALFRNEEIWLCKTVILESVWVLRSLYRTRLRRENPDSLRSRHRMLAEYYYSAALAGSVTTAGAA